jgi:hypothetical protein
MLSGLPSWGAAQVIASVDGGVATATYDGYAPSAVYTLAPAVSFSGGPLRLGLDGAFSEFETGHGSGTVALNATAGGEISGPLRWELSGDGAALWYRSNPGVLSGLVTPRLRLDRGAFGAWVAGSVGSTDNDNLTGSFVDRIDGGMSYALPHVTPTVSVATVRAGIAHYTDVGAAIQSELGRFALSTAGGTRIRTLSRGDSTLLRAPGTWLNVELRVTVMNGMALVLAGGSYPTDLVRGTPGAHFIGGGIRLSQAFRVNHRPTMVAVRYNSSGSNDVLADPRTLRFSAKPNARVELMADFTEWQPVVMTETRPGLYQVTLRDAIRSGPHRVNIRVDNGNWDVPGELPPVIDDFGGTAGSLVIP